ncbi:MAG: GYF domain-containing protein [Oligoflexia bacterium]|nr:GYF domain-containing protein [Oligoflexia bacterium]
MVTENNGKIWYVVVNGKADGPHPIDEIQSRLKAGKLNYTDLVFRPGLTRWVPLAECAEFERRAESITQTSGKPDIPNDQDVNGWILLVKHTNAEGKENYIQSGPHLPDQIIEKLARGEVKYDDHAWQKGLKTWSSLGSIEEFERRSPMDHAKGPMPELSSPPLTSPELTVTEAPLIAATTAFDDEKTASAVETQNVAVASNLETIANEDVTPSTPKLHHRRRLIIATSGAVFGMALAFAGVQAYQQSLEQVAPPGIPERVVASQKTQVEVPSVQVPVHPEVQNPVEVPPSLKIVVLKPTSPKPQLLFETNLQGGAVIDLEITAELGAILKYPTFSLKKKITVVAGQMPSIDLAAENLPPGEYKASANAGTLLAQTKINLGVQDIAFKKKLAVFKKSVVKQALNEKKQLNRGVGFLTKSYSTMTAQYKKVKSSNNALLKKKWAASLNIWRKQHVKESQFVKEVNERTYNKYAYPDQLMRYKTLNKELFEIAKNYDQNIKTGRQIASAEVNVDQFKGRLGQLQKDIKRLKK